MSPPTDDFESEGSEDGLDMRQVAALVDEAMREEDEGDPLLEKYQCFSRP